VAKTIRVTVTVDVDPLTWANDHGRDLPNGSEAADVEAWVRSCLRSPLTWQGAKVRTVAAPSDLLTALDSLR
jgi:hypothetical protein